VPGQRIPGRGRVLACPRLPAAGPQRLLGEGQLAGCRGQRDASTLEAGGAARYAADRWPGAASGPGRRPGEAGAARRGGVVADATARLIFACRDRRPAVRRTVPLTYGESRLAQNMYGDHSCRGVRPGAPPASAGSAGHLGPHEPGQLAGDRHGSHPGRLAAGGELAVGGVQPLLRLPGPGQRRWGKAVLAPAQRGADRRPVPLRPCCLDQGGAHT
jgi:hypothetical protein